MTDILQDAIDAELAEPRAKRAENGGGGQPSYPYPGKAAWNAAIDAELAEEATQPAQGPSEGAARAAAALSGKLPGAGQSKHYEVGQSPDDYEEFQENLTVPGPIGEALNAMGAGVAEAGFQTKDFVLGEPAQEDKSDFRQGVEAQREMRQEHQSFVYGLTEGVAQFATGMIGVGKITAPIRAAAKGKAALAAYEVGRGAAAGALVLDPHEERLSNLVQQFPDLQNPVTDYLAADPKDSAAEGRFKNALEGIGMDFALIGIFAASTRALRLGRAGKVEEANAALEEATSLSVQRDGPADEAAEDLAADAALGAELDEALVADLQATPTRAGDVGPGQAVDPLDAELEGALATDLRTLRPNDATLDAVGERAVAGALGDLTSAPARPGDAVVDRAAELAVATELNAKEIVEGFEADRRAIAAAGSREAAETAGHTFAKGGRTPDQLLYSEAGARELVDRTVEALRPQFDVARGGAVLSDARVRAMIGSRADLFGEDPDLLLGALRSQGEAAQTMAADMGASFLVANKLAHEVMDLAKRIRMGTTESLGMDEVKAGDRLRLLLAKQAEVVAAGRSMAANAGRTLRRARSDFKVTPEQLEAMKGYDPKVLAKLLEDADGNPAAIVALSNPSFLSRVVEEATFSMTNGLLWLYPTHVVNVTSNAYMTVARPTEKFIGALALGGRGTELRKRAVREYALTVGATMDALGAALKAFKQGDSTLAPHADEYFQQSRRTSTKPMEWKAIEGPMDLLENVVKSISYRNVFGLPTRALGTMDELFRTMRYHAVVKAKALSEADARGLSGKERDDFVQEQFAGSFDEAGRGLDVEALRESSVTTFQQELDYETHFGAIGKSVSDFRAAVPATAFILPFVKTPVNVLRYAWKMTPGLNLLQKEYTQALRGAKGDEAKAHAIGQMSLGALALSAAASLTLAGKLTGGGPRDLTTRKEMEATGWRPYSIVLEGDDGARTYFPLGRFDPVGMAMSIAADLVEMQQINANAKDVEKGLGAVALAVARNFSDKTFFQSLTQFFRAASDPERHLAKQAGTMARAILPASSLIRGTNPDPYLRDARGLLDTILKDLPGYSETLPPVRTALGEPVLKRIGVTTDDTADFVEAENNRIALETGWGLTPPSPRRKGVDLRETTLENGRQAFDYFQELSGTIKLGGLTLKERLRQVIESNAYQRLPDGAKDVRGTKVAALAKILSGYREAAFATVLRESPLLKEAVQERQRKVLDAYKENRAREQTGKEGTAEALLEKLGH
ncbi:MAG: hypothetical protein AAF311_02815 [Pseudomonadota bacterium]